ncbi:MAG: hypothetical protein QM820_36045 [Minicystis sp.]
MRALRPALLSLALAALAACGNKGAPSGAAASASVATARPSSSAPPPATPATPAATARPSAATSAQPNPLHLPPVRTNLQVGRRIFTVPEPMLAAARPGSTLVFQAGTVTGIDGDDLVVESRGAPPYRVHPGYVIAVPDEPKLKPGDPVITEQNGVMKHGVVTKFIRDRIGVRYTDLEGRAQEALLLGGLGKPIAGAPSKAARFVKQIDGLQPGNYAALRQGEEWAHVLLVSGFGEGDARRWLALGFGGAAMVVSEGDLAPIPVKLGVKVGTVVWAESGGKMRRAIVQAADDQGLFTVKFERAGRPATVGWGLVMKPVEG